MHKKSIAVAACSAMVFVMLILVLVDRGTSNRSFTKEDAIERFGFVDEAEFHVQEARREEVEVQLVQATSLLAEETKKRIAIERELEELRRRLRTVETNLEEALSVPDENELALNTPLPDGHAETFGADCSSCHQ